MNRLQKWISLASIILLFVSTLGISSAKASCYATRNPLAPVLKEVIIDADGNLSAYVRVEPEYLEHMQLVFMDKRGREQWRIPVNTVAKQRTETVTASDLQGQEIQVKVKTGEIRISHKELDELSVDAKVYLEVRNYQPKEKKTTGEYFIDPIVSEEACGKFTLQSEEESIYFTKSKESAFPGYVKISEGSIQIVINLTTGYEKAKFTLVVLNENGQVVKRIPVQTKNPTLSSKSLSLSAGTYTVQLEMTNGGSKTYSESVKWVISAPKVEFSIPSGAQFPGNVTINSNGTIKVTLKVSSSYQVYEYYLVVVDAWGNEVRRVSIDPSNVNQLISNLNLTTGGYTLYIEVIDSASQEYAQSLSTFYTVNTSGQIIVFIDGELQNYSKPPVKINSRVLVPMRAVFEAFGAKVDWDEATQSVTATRGNDVIKLTIGSKTAYKNGQPILMDVPAILYNNETTMVPIRFVSEALGAKVSWDGYSNSVVISN
ncbi:hypothetical protein T458_11760 [Brevibacillus panacihumi W25]|uniref:Copper amine oxidase-like N-terminal domain-containing protein n=1 Tax=Brevibacillus panacihumi W25 TaxID=1408254 RepID=V6MGL6_9BACL|nr:copper amine oxidase N-terminal domain-containing protein [Brevibacillus panacihumi]EST54533.1 hypothetical protein T458_11760 [Brevibacillus panacihumi W25]